MDIIDQANDRVEMDLRIALSVARTAPAPLPYIGKCHNCGAPLPESMRYCDKQCCEDHEHRLKRQAYTKQ